VREIDAFIADLTAADIVIVVILLGAFVVGWIQGVIRQLLGLGAYLAAFVLAANLRDPLGDFLSRNWTFFAPEFNSMVALLALWIAISITLTIAIQMFYRRVPIVSRFTWIDELLGGLLGLGVAALVIGLAVIALDTFYRITGVPDGADVQWMRQLWKALDESAVVAVYRDTLIPGVTSVLKPLLPGLPGI